MSLATNLSLATRHFLYTAGENFPSVPGFPKIKREEKTLRSVSEFLQYRHQMSASIHYCRCTVVA